jgi:hypothetical protein
MSDTSMSSLITTKEIQAPGSNKELPVLYGRIQYRNFFPLTHLNPDPIRIRNTAFPGDENLIMRRPDPD